MTKTKAAVLREINEPLSIEELETPELKEGQVLVKVLYTGLCRSQINEIKGNKGEDKYLPHTLGHEGSGIVEAVGEGVTKVVKGDYVVLTWIKSEGKDVPSAQYLDESGKKVNSGAISTFLQFAVISENRLVKVDQRIEPRMAALLGCALPTGGGLIKNELVPATEETIAIFGVGGIGASVLLEAKALGCSKIIAIDVNDDKLMFAKEQGAWKTINSLQEDVTNKIRELTSGGVDGALECSGIKSVMETAFRAIQNQGRLVIAGNLKQGETISIDPMDLIKGKKITGTWGGASKPDEDIPFYVQQYLEGKLNLSCLVSKEYSLEDINLAITDLEEGKVLRAMINCQK